MKNDIAGTLLDFYHNILQPEFTAIKEKLHEHDEKFRDIIDHFDSLYNRLGRLEDEYLMVMHGVKRIEESLESGNVKRSDLEKMVRDLKGRFSDIQSRIEHIERQLASA